MVEISRTSQQGKMENVNTCTLPVTQLLWETMALESTGECTSAAAAAAKSLQSCPPTLEDEWEGGETGEACFEQRK